MILIITNNIEQSTCNVVDWLSYWGVSYTLITDSDCIEIIRLSLDGSFKIKVNDRIIDSSDIKSVWYRRGNINVKRSKNSVNDKDKDIFNSFNNYATKEAQVLIEFVHYTFLKKKNINNYLLVNVNKLIVLKSAVRIGLLIPPTLVTSNKNELLAFSKRHGSVITKGMTAGLSFESDNYRYYGYTENVDNELISRLDDFLFPSFFQKKIEKLCDIRVFSINNTVYGMAIFSQNNDKTKLDFRHYDKMRPNRCVPYRIPYKLHQQIMELMAVLKLNSCSIDFIYGTDKKIYFLEVNPVGQFGMVSHPCNYYIEKHIAKELLNEKI